jgi:hypothetical protein
MKSEKGEIVYGFWNSGQISKTITIEEFNK